jgi:hypothetical protein
VISNFEFNEAFLNYQFSILNRLLVKLIIATSLMHPAGKGRSQRQLAPNARIPPAERGRVVAARQPLPTRKFSSKFKRR